MGHAAAPAAARCGGSECSVAVVAVLERGRAGWPWAGGWEGWGEEGREAVGQEGGWVAYAFLWHTCGERSLYVVRGYASFQPGGHRGGEAAYVLLAEVESGVVGAEAREDVAGRGGGLRLRG